MSDAVKRSHFILFVRDQGSSRRFYERVLNQAASLDAPGMTEFELPGNAILGLMPEAGIARLLAPALPDPAAARGTPRSELYLVVDDPVAHHGRAVEAGARELSPLAPRDWGHDVAYSLDPDSHLLAFAQVSENSG